MERVAAERPGGIILAGGKSKRFGRDKALSRLAGRSLLSRAIDLLSTRCSEIIVVGRASINVPVPPQEIEIRAVEDLTPDLGPIGGLLTGFSKSIHDLNIVLAVDMPFVITDLFEKLITHLGDADAAVPLAAGQMQPLCAVYRSRCLSVVEEYIREGGRAVFGFLDRIKVNQVALRREELLDDVDTQEQLLQAEIKLKEIGD